MSDDVKSEARQLLERFMALFKGSTRSYGQWVPSSGEMFSNMAKCGEKQYLAHLRGERGLGLVPIMDDNTCWFAAIDLDCHDEATDPPIDFEAVAARIDELKLPLTVCKSKSGTGAHCYLFGVEPLSCTLVSQALVRWSAQIGYAGHEIFPKQTRLVMDGNELQLGNWINLPYFAARDTRRFARAGGQQLDIGQFLDRAESLRVTPTQLTGEGAADHNEAPPCFQRMVAEGVPDGFRNEALYHATVYLRRAFSDDWKDRAMLFNEQSIQTPLPGVEAERTIKSAGRRDYRYKCNQEPCKGLCNRTVCLTRKFGITPENVVGDPGAPPMPEITAVRRYNSEPPRYELTADNVVVSCNSDTLQLWRLLRKRLADALLRTMPAMKEDAFEQVVLARMFSMVETVIVPEEASPAGLARERCCEWLKKATIARKGDDRQAVLRKQPVVTMVNDELVYLFRSQDFVDHLRRIRAEELRGSELYHALLPLGLKSKSVRVGKHPIKLWVLPYAVTEDEELDPKQFKSEF